MADMLRHVKPVLNCDWRWARALCDKEIVRLAQNPTTTSAAIFQSTLTNMEREMALVNQDAMVASEYGVTVYFGYSCTQPLPLHTVLFCLRRAARCVLRR